MARSRSHFQLELPLAADLGIAFSGRQLERGDAGVLVEVMGYDTHGFRVHFLAYQLLSPFSFFFQRSILVFIIGLMSGEQEVADASANLGFPG